MQPQPCHKPAFQTCPAIHIFGIWFQKNQIWTEVIPSFVLPCQLRQREQLWPRPCLWAARSRMAGCRRRTCWTEVSTKIVNYHNKLRWSELIFAYFLDKRSKLPSGCSWSRSCMRSLPLLRTIQSSWARECSQRWWRSRQHRQSVRRIV